MIDKGTIFGTAAGAEFRLLAITGTGAKRLAHVFGMDDPKALPRQWKFADLEEGLRSGEYKPLPSSRMPVKTRSSTDDDEEKNASLELQTKRWSIIEPLVSQPGLFFRKLRGPLVAKRAVETGASENTILTCLRLYWRGGMTRDALRGAYDKCGTPKDPAAKAGYLARGRRPKNNRYAKFVWTDELKEKVLATAKRLLKKKRTNTRGLIYRRVIALHFYVIGEDGKKRQRPLGERPTRAQVYHLLDKHRTLESTLRRKLGDDDFENNVEPKTGSARDYAGHVGQYYEIDSTIPDVWICADEDPSVVIGKATLYLIVDVFSRLIVGFHLTLDKPSWMGAMEAMLSLVEDKRKLCERWGFEYRQEDWVAHGIWPAFFRADRGSEFISHDSDTVSEDIDTGVINTPRRRAPRKGTVECSFKLVQVPIKDHTGGYTPPAEMGRRQTDDHKGEATRTLRSVGHEVLAGIRLNNHRVHTGIKLPAEHVWVGKQPIPTNIWETDYPEQAGALTRFDEDYLRFKLLPSDEFTVTPTGVFHGGLLWEPDRAVRKQWLLPATQGFYKVTATFDRRLVDVIYVHDKKDPSKWTTMHLSTKCSRYLGMSFAQVEAVEEARLTLAQLAEEHNLALAIQHDEEAIAREEAARRVTQDAIRKAGGRSRTSTSKQTRDAQANAARRRVKTLATTAAPSEPTLPAAPSAPAAPKSVLTSLPPGGSGVNRPAATSANHGLQALLNLRKKS